MFAYCGNNPVNNSDPTGHAFGAIIGGIIGGILGGISAAASGKSVVTGIATGALTGAIVGGICDGTTWAVGAVFGAMVKCAAVAAVGNVLNQTINYGIETYRSNKSHNTANGTQARNTAATSKANKPEQSVVHNYFNYLDGGEVLKAACATAAFVPLSVGGGYLVNSIFNAPTASQFVAEFAIGQNISMLQTAAEYIIQIFE